jgi:hypothetical protein
MRKNKKKIMFLKWENLFFGFFKILEKKSGILIPDSYFTV